MKRLYSFFPVLFLSMSFLFYISDSINNNNSSQSKEVTSVCNGNKESLLEYELKRLRDPETGTIPPYIRRLELNYAASLPGYLSDPSSKMSSINWKSRGPWHVGGRTRAFAIDVSNPSILLAGSTSGGMWTSLNGGISWIQNWNAVHQSVSCIAQDTRTGKTNTWYIGTGEGYGQSASTNGSGGYYLGNGMYKSTDGGQTWNSLPATVSGTPQSFDNVWDIIWNTATNPADMIKDVVYAATYNAILKSSDGGVSWTVAKGSTTTGPFSYFTDVAVSANGIIYGTLSSDGSQKGIYRSADGLTWTNITPSGFPAIYGRIKIGIAPSDENQVYFFASATTGFGTPDTNLSGVVEWNSLWKYDHTISGGKWFNLSANLPTAGGPFDKQYTQGGYNMTLKVHPADTAIVFLGGTNLYRSTSGFFNPNNTSLIGGYEKGTAPPVINLYPNHHPDQHELVFSPGDPEIMYSTNGGGIFKTMKNTASTVTWTPLNNGYLTSLFYTVAVDPTGPNDSTIIGGAQDNGNWFINSNNALATWSQPWNGNGSYCAIANNKLNYYFSVQNGKMIRATLDASGAVQAFSRIDPIGGKGYQFINPYVLDPNNNNTMYLAGGKILWRNNALNTIPMNSNWDSISTGWTAFPDTVPVPNARITAIAVSKNPANVLYYGTSSQSVYRIDNANTGTPKATDITGPLFPMGNVSCIAIDPLDSRKVMVAFSNYNIYSIFYSTDADAASPTWTKVAGNLEQNTTGTGNGPSVRWVSILPVSDGTVFLAATSTGLYATDTLAGASTSWIQQGASTIGNSICNMIDCRLFDGLVAVATHSHGIFSANIKSVNDVLSSQNIGSFHFNLENFPNPFSNSTTIHFMLAKNSRIKLSLYDVHGKLIRTLADDEFHPGEHRIHFSENTLAPGVYYYSLKCRETGLSPDKHSEYWQATETKKMIILR